MSARGAAIVARARALIGIRFRPQGRSAAEGLDCIGVMAMASGIEPKKVRRDYRLSFSDLEAANANFDSNGLIRLAPAEAEPGDFLVVRPGPMHLHVILLTELGYLHADAGLRRVVEVPGPVRWPVLSAWRCPGDGVVAARVH